jgi:hypothetical protein
MNANDRQRLTKIAELMLAEAQSSDQERIFSATGFAHENISILHQQVRCANLAWALRHTKKVKRGDVVAIVGGSFSGLMLACSLAIADDVIVYIFEKDKRLLNRFLDKSHRHLSPNLNSRYLGVRFDPVSSSPFYIPAIFAWKPDVASEVAHEWLSNFEKYRRALPIFTFTECEVKSEDIRQHEQRIRINLKRPERPHLQPVEADLLIDATGFGDEANPHGLADYSYWEAGHRLIYNHLGRGNKVLVSGCGDSGIIEAMHYAIKDFQHRFVEDLWPHANLEARLDLGLAKAKLDDILLSEEILRYDGKIISELCWWLDTWFRLENWAGRGWSLPKYGPHAKPIFQAIENALKPHLLKAFTARRLKQLDWNEREAFLLNLKMGSQLAIREAIMPLVENWISRNIAKLVRKLPAGTLLNLRKLHERRRLGIAVTINGVMPTIYTRQLSSYNVWLARILTTFPNVRYRQGKIMKVEAEEAGPFMVTFEDRSHEAYDRVVTRYGPATFSSRPILSTKFHRDPHRGNWLLTPVSYGVPTANPHISRVIDPAKDEVARKLQGVLRRRGSDRMPIVNKMLYKSRLLLGPSPVANAPEYFASDPQAWLSAKLRSGIRPTYEENLDVGLIKRRSRNQKR